jgi:hypothetical protein
MRLVGRAVCLLAAAWVAGCAAPPPRLPDDYDLPEPPLTAPAGPAPMVEYPPIEPVEPPPEPVATPPPAAPPAAPAPAPAAAPEPAAPSPPPPTLASIPESALAKTLPPVHNVVAPPEISPEEQQMNALLADLHRYGNLSAEDARRELAAMTQQLAKQRTDSNRIRLATLYTVTRAGPQDDLRALQLLDNVAKSGPGSPAVKQLAVVLHVQISERVRAVRDEQQKADAAIQKLEALRAMERSLLRDRVRGGGGGGTGGSSGGAGGGSAGSGGG